MIFLTDRYAPATTVTGAYLLFKIINLPKRNTVINIS